MRITSVRSDGSAIVRGKAAFPMEKKKRKKKRRHPSSKENREIWNCFVNGVKYTYLFRKNIVIKIILFATMHLFLKYANTDLQVAQADVT